MADGHWFAECRGRPTLRGSAGRVSCHRRERPLRASSLLLGLSSEQRRPGAPVPSGPLWPTAGRIPGNSALRAHARQAASSVRQGGRARSAGREWGARQAAGGRRRGVAASGGGSSSAAREWLSATGGRRHVRERSSPLPSPL
eukprot:5347275-Pyramimonas_sp.AAC.1